jgi:BlaI family penicillinase repressor
MAAPDPDPQLTPLQLDLMRVLWTRKEASVQEVHAALAQDRGLAPTTIATLLRRLEKRGLVAHRTEGRQFLFRARVGEEEARGAMVAELAERLFGGDPAQLVHHLLSKNQLRAGDLARVRKLIDEHEQAHAKQGRSRRAAR